MENDFSSMDRLMELGMSMAVAGQMTSAMNKAISDMKIPGQPYAGPQLPGQTIRGCGQNEIAATGYFLTLDGKVSGPFDSDELKKIARNGILNMDVPAWCQGMSAWVKASDIPELNKIITLSGV